jgi:uncharacterized glyoxalase superfamily protein PhnB
MAKRSLSEQLDRAVAALLAGTEPAPLAEPRLAPLVRTAKLLRGLPADEFRDRLKTDLLRRVSMTTTTVRAVPAGYHTITAYLTVPGAVELIDFVKAAFGAEERFRGTGGAGGVHCEVRIGDSMLMIGGGGAWRGTPMPTALHLYVPDADAVYRRALEAGGTSLREPTDQPYGDREAGIKDASGNFWYIATHQGPAHVPEGLRSLTVCLQPKGADQQIDFLKRAFAAEEVSMHRSPEGAVRHATFKIGDSVLELGEAHGEFQPMPTMFYLYVDDVDAWYGRAVRAGGTSLSALADQDYGDRTGAVTDPFGNIWYMATHIRD